MKNYRFHFLFKFKRLNFDDDETVLSVNIACQSNPLVICLINFLDESLIIVPVAKAIKLSPLHLDFIKVALLKHFVLRLRTLFLIEELKNLHNLYANYLKRLVITKDSG